MIVLLCLFVPQELFEGLRERSAEARRDAELDPARFDRSVLLARDAGEVEFSHEMPAPHFDYSETLSDLFRRNVAEEFLGADTSGIDGSRLVELAYLSPTVYDAYKYYVTLSQAQSAQFFAQWARMEAAAGDLPARRRARSALSGAQGTLYESLQREPEGAEASVLEFVPSLTDAEREALRSIVGDVVFTRDGLRAEGLRRGGLQERYEELRREYEESWPAAPPGMPGLSEAEVRAIEGLDEPTRRHVVASVASAAARAEATMTAHLLAEALEGAEMVADVDVDVARELSRMRALLESQVRRLGEHADAQEMFVAAQSAAASAGIVDQRTWARRWVAAQAGPAERGRGVSETPSFGEDAAVRRAWEAGSGSTTAPARRWLDGGGWGWAELRIVIEEDEVRVEVDP